MKNVIGLILIFVSFSALAQDLDLGNGGTISQQRLEAFRSLLKPTTEDKTFYHWTNKSNAVRWASQGQIDQGEMAFLNTPTGELQSYGPGFYLAESPTSSNSFGEAPVSITVKKGTLVYDKHAAMKTFGRPLTFREEALVAERLSLLRPAVNDWYIVNNQEFTKKVFYSAYADPNVKVSVLHSVKWNPFTNAESLKDLVNSGDQEVKYLRDVIYASDYMDGISFARAMKINPGAPWMEFEPENFEKYKNTIDYLSSKNAENIRKADELQNKMRTNLTEVMLDVHNKLNGKNEASVISFFRTEGVRAGGDEVGKTFEVTKEQLEVLQKNPYLEVEVITKDGKTFVSYHYPDVFHYKKLKGMISPKLYQTLEKNPAEVFMKDAEARNLLNRVLIKELYDDFVTKFYKGKADWVDLISIHPFADYNGRTVRLLQKIADPTITNTFLGDFDLLLPKEFQSATAVTATAAQNELMADLFDELIRAKTEKRMPDYIKTKAIDKYLNNAYVVPMKLNLDSGIIQDKIAQRKWPDLFNEGISNYLQDVKKDALNLTPDFSKRIKWASHPHVIPFYTDAQKNELALTIDGVLNEKKIPVLERAEIFQRFDALVKDYPAIKNISPEKMDQTLENLTTDLAERIKDDFVEQKNYQHFKTLEELDSNRYRQILHLDKAAQKFDGDVRKAVAVILDQKLSDFFVGQELSAVTTEQKTKLVQIYNRNLSEILNRHASITSFKQTLKNHSSVHEMAKLPGLITIEEAEKIVLKRTLPINTQLDFQKRTGDLKLYASFYDNSSPGAKAAFASPTEIWTKLESDIIKDINALDNATVVSIVNELDAFDKPKKMQFLMKNYDQFKDPNYIGSLLVKELGNDVYQGRLPNGDRLKALNEAPEVFAFLHQKGITGEELKASIQMYQETYDTAEKSIRSQVKSPREISEMATGTTSVRTWAGNCVNGLLKALFP